MEEQILQSLMLRPGLGDVSAELLTDMITDCMTELKDYLNYQESEELPAACGPIVKELVLIRFNRDGTQGEQSESNSGVSVTYLTDLPADLKRRIHRHRKMRR